MFYSILGRLGVFLTEYFFKVFKDLLKNVLQIFVYILWHPKKKWFHNRSVYHKFEIKQLMMLPGNFPELELQACPRNIFSIPEKIFYQTKYVVCKLFWQFYNGNELIVFCLELLIWLFHTFLLHVDIVFSVSNQPGQYFM